jgi:methylglutamate dehydrogenase subunit D
VAELILTERSPLHDLAAPRRCGAHRDRPSGVTLSALTGIAVAHVVARKDKVAQTQDGLAVIAGVRPNDRPRVIGTGGVSLIGCAPGEWLAVAEAGRAKDLVAALTKACIGAATATDQTSAKIIVRVSGPHVRDTLAKGCPIDLHPSVFKPGDAATTRIAHIDCTLWQAGAEPAYDLAVDRSIAASFWVWFTTSAAEYSYRVV